MYTKCYTKVLNNGENVKTHSYLKHYCKYIKHLNQQSLFFILNGYIDHRQVNINYHALRRCERCD